MKENTQEKSLIEEGKKGIFFRIKNFFKNLFGKKQVEVNNRVVNEEADIKETNNEFMDYIKMTKDEESQLLELQRKYRKGEIAEGDLTEEQIDALSNLYDKQIAELKVAIEKTNREIEEYKKRKMQKMQKKNA